MKKIAAQVTKMSEQDIYDEILQSPDLDRSKALLNEALNRHKEPFNKTLGIFNLAVLDPTYVANPQTSRILLKAIGRVISKGTKESYKDMLHSYLSHETVAVEPSTLMGAVSGDATATAIAMLAKGTPPKTTQDIIKHFNLNDTQTFIPRNPANAILEEIYSNLGNGMSWDNPNSGDLIVMRMKDDPGDTWAERFTRGNLNLATTTQLLSYVDEHGAREQIRRNLDPRENELNENLGFAKKVVDAMQGGHHAPNIGNLLDIIRSTQLTPEQKAIIVDRLNSQLQHHMGWAVGSVINQVSLETPARSPGGEGVAHKIIRIMNLDDELAKTIGTQTGREVKTNAEQNIELNQQNKEYIETLLGAIMNNQAAKGGYMQFDVPSEFYENIRMFPSHRNELTGISQENNIPQEKSKKKQEEEDDEYYEDDDIYDFNPLASGESWYKQASDDELLKEAGLKENAMGLIGGVLLFLMGVPLMDAATRTNSSPDQIESAVSNQQFMQDFNKDPKVKQIRQQLESLWNKERESKEHFKGWEARDAEEKGYAQIADVLAKTIYAEARGESYEGKIAVASVIYNRAKGNVEKMDDVCLARKQFSCWNDGPIPEGSGKMWDQSVQIANDMVKGNFNPTTKADHYYNPDLADPIWAYTDKTRSELKPHDNIGNHRFMKLYR
jgi:spore germination cell wall hydrolase CwlJ-like protein